MITVTEIDRLAVRQRPRTNPVLLQNWVDLLFLHWPVEPDVLRPIVPAGLELDLWEGRAWIGVTPFAMSGVRATMLPPLPGLSEFLELNVRTYVHYQGKPGVFFFSLDCSKTIPTWAARFTYGLPYHQANMEFFRRDGAFEFSSKRVNASAQFHAEWRPVRSLGVAGVDSLEFFLVERYGLFVSDGNAVYFARIFHQPWVLEQATVLSYGSSVIQAIGIPEPKSAPLAHFSHFQSVETWMPERL